MSKDSKLYSFMRVVPLAWFTEPTRAYEFRIRLLVLPLPGTRVVLVDHLPLDLAARLHTYQ